MRVPRSASRRYDARPCARRRASYAALLPVGGRSSDPMRLSALTILLAVGVWILGNIVLPLLVNAIERLFQAEIDRAVARGVSTSLAALFWAIQVGVVIFFLPVIAMIRCSTWLSGLTEYRRSDKSKPSTPTTYP